MEPLRNLTPEFRDGNAPANGQNWRHSYADGLTADPMFARIAVNRISKVLFQLGLAAPMDNLHPARLVHDALSQAPGNWANYTPQGFAEPVRSAWLLLDPSEPGGAAGALMGTFLRGNRDTQLRRQEGSILQSLRLMNDT